MASDHTRIEIHADGDKEQSKEHVAKRLDVLLDLVAIFGLRDKHTGKKCTERKRKPRDLGERCQTKRDQQNVEHEKLGRTLSRDEMKPGACRSLTEKQDHRQRQCGFDTGERQALPEIGPAFGDGRNRYQKRYHGEILKQKYAHRVAAVRGVELGALSQHLQYDSGRAHRQGAAKSESREPSVAQEMQREHGCRRRNRYLREPKPEHRAAPRLQLRRAELEADGKHEEHDAELGAI